MTANINNQHCETAFQEASKSRDGTSLNTDSNDVGQTNVTSRHLPDEIMVQILREVLSLPNGIQGERHQAIMKNRVNKFAIVSRQTRQIVPEAVYKHNKVVIQPRPGSSDDQFTIAYPAAPQNSWVRELEFEAWMHHLGRDPYPPAQTVSGVEIRLSPQLSWLRTLASGSIGFQNLDILRLVFNVNRYPSADRYCSDAREPLQTELINFCHGLRIVGPFSFKAKKLEIVVNGHVCTGAHCERKDEYYGAFCRFHAELSTLLLAQAPALK
jgi:hypothetical protein